MVVFYQILGGCQDLVDGHFKGIRVIIFFTEGAEDFGFVVLELLDSLKDFDHYHDFIHQTLADPDLGCPWF